MKRSEFLKRLGLGLGAAVAAPSLLKSEETVQEYDKTECTNSVGEAKKLVFWRQSDTVAITATSSYIFELESQEFNRRFIENMDKGIYKALSK
jgi:hypothetical protein